VTSYHRPRQAISRRWCFGPPNVSKKPDTKILQTRAVQLETHRSHGSRIIPSTILVHKIGLVPTDFLRLEELNPDFLDIVGVSLALRGLTASTPGRREDPDNLDLIRVNPEVATAYEVAAMAHPKVPWNFVRDALLTEWPMPIDWFSVGFQPQPGAFQFFPTPGGAVLLNDLDFDAWRSQVFFSQMNHLQADAEWRFYNAVFPTINAMPYATSNCGNAIFEILSFGGSCGELTYTARGPLLKELNDLATHGNDLYVYSSTLTTKECIGPYVHTNDVITVGIDENTKEFLTSYVSGPCTGGNRGTVNFPAPLSDSSHKALNVDPILLNRYQLDLVKSSDDWESRFAVILQSALQRQPTAAASLNFLQSTDLTYYLSAQASPLGSWDQISMQRISELRDEATDVALAPLIKTSAGLDLADDLAAIASLNAHLPPKPNLPQLKISDQFIGELRDEEVKNAAAIAAKVDTEAAEFLAALNPQKSWSFGIGFSSVGGDASFGVFLNFKGVDIDVTLPIAAPVGPAPALPSLELPELPLALPLAALTGASRGLRRLRLPGSCPRLTSRDTLGTDLRPSMDRCLVWGFNPRCPMFSGTQYSARPILLAGLG
jgi:hypothetical protein